MLCDEWGLCRFAGLEGVGWERFEDSWMVASTQAVFVRAHVQLRIHSALPTNIIPL